MKRRRPVSYAEDDYSDESEYEEADRNRDIDNNKVRNGRNRESRSGSRTRTNLRGQAERNKKPRISSESASDSDSNRVVSNGKILLSTLRDDSLSSRDPSPSSSLENKPQEAESDLITLESDEGNDQNKESWWELDAESGKYVEKGPNLKGFKLKLKMRVKVREDHLHLRHVEAGNALVKCHVKLDNVRESLGIKHGGVDQPIRMETHTPETHPLICPFFCSETNTPCEVSFQRIDQKYFVEHVIDGKCPYSKGKKLEDFLPSQVMICDICKEEVSEKEAQQHMDQKHFKICCPACKSRYQDRIDVEDHIINDHATHFMSQLSSIYRKAKHDHVNKKIIKQPEPETVPEEEKVPELSEYQTLEDLIREKKEYDKMIREQALYLAGLQGPDKTNSANKFLLNISSTGPAGQPRPPLPSLPGSMRPPVNRMQGPAVMNNYGQKTKGAKKVRQASPGGLRMRGPKPISPAGQESLQQVRLQNGNLVWAVAKEILQPTVDSKKKMLFQVLCPVVPGAPPPVLVKKPSGPRPIAPLAPLPVRRYVKPGTMPIPRQPTVRPTYHRPNPPRPIINHTVPPPANQSIATKIVLQRTPQLLQTPLPPKLPQPPTPSPSIGPLINHVNRVNTSNNHLDHSYRQSRTEMDDEIEEIDPHDPLALDEGVDPLAGLDPYEDVDKDITIVS